MPNLYQLLNRINGYDDFPIFDIVEAKTNEDGTFTVTVKTALFSAKVGLSRGSVNTDEADPNNLPP